MDAAERQVALKRLLGLAVVFTVAFVISGWLPSPESEAGDEAVIIPLREAPAAIPVAEAVRGEGRAPTSTRAPVRRSAPTSASAPVSASPAAASAATRSADGRDGATRAPVTRPSTIDTSPAAAATQWWVQAASYRDPQIARHGESRLEALGLPSQLQKTQVADAELWRLRAGPFSDHEAAEAARRRLEAEGFVGARTLSIP